MTSDVDVENYKRSPKPVCLPHLITLQYYSLLRFFVQKLATTSVPCSCALKHTHTHNRFTALFWDHPGEPVSEEKLLDIMVQGKINRGRHTDHPDGCHSIRTNQCPPSIPLIFYRPDALHAAQPTVSKH